VETKIQLRLLKCSLGEKIENPHRIPESIEDEEEKEIL